MRLEIFEEVEKMNDGDKQALLNTQFPEALEKEANAEIDATLLADALYNYGWLQGQRAIAEVDGLDKVAAEDLQAHEAAEKEVSEQIEGCLSSLGTTSLEDSAELHKEAQVAAALIFDGYSDCMEKAASVKELAHKAMEAMKKGHGAAKAHVMAHKGKYSHGGAALGGAAIGSGLYAAKKHMDKKSSELTVAELLDIVREDQAFSDAINSGVEKLAAKGKMKGEKLKKMHEKASKSSSSSSSNSK